MVEAGYAGTNVKASGKEAASGILLIVALIVGLVLILPWLLKKLITSTASNAFEIVSDAAKEAATATKEAMTKTALTVIPQESGYNATIYRGTDPAAIAAEQRAVDIQQRAYTQGVAQQYADAGIGTKLALAVDTAFGGGTYAEVQTDNQRLINALLPLSFSGNAGYVENWINNLSWFDAIWYKTGIQSKTPAEIRTMVGDAFTTWLTRNYDSSGNARV